MRDDITIGWVLQRGTKRIMRDDGTPALGCNNEWSRSCVMTQPITVVPNTSAMVATMNGIDHA